MSSPFDPPARPVTPPDLEHWLARILDPDPMTFEDAYWGRRPSAADAVPRVVELLATTVDPSRRGKLLELLGESGDPTVAAVLEAELRHPDEVIRQWAEQALSALREPVHWEPGVR